MSLNELKATDYIGQPRGEAIKKMEQQVGEWHGRHVDLIEWQKLTGFITAAMAIGIILIAIITLSIVGQKADFTLMAEVFSPSVGFFVIGLITFGVFTVMHRNYLNEILDENGAQQLVNEAKSAKGNQPLLVN